MPPCSTCQHQSIRASTNRIPGIFLKRLENTHRRLEVLNPSIFQVNLFFQECHCFFKVVVSLQIQATVDGVFLPA